MKRHRKQLKKASEDILLLWNCTYKTGNGYGYIERKGDDVISLEKSSLEIL
jgi:hypothetical protein